VLFLSRPNIARLRRLWTYIVAKSCPSLQDQALLGLLLFPGQQSSPGGVLEYFSDALVRLGRALEVLLSTNLLAHILGLVMLVN
jgi:hypothetical protein